MLLGTDDVQIVRRHCVIWAVADIVRTARLIVAVNDAAKEVIAVTSYLEGDERAEVREVRLGAMLEVMQKHFAGMAALSEWHEPDSPRAPHRPNKIVSHSKQLLLAEPDLQKAEEKVSELGLNYRALIKTLNAGIQENIEAIKSARAREPLEEEDEASTMTCSANESFFKFTFHLSPLAALALVAIRSSQALDVLVSAGCSRDVKVVPALVSLPWASDVKLSTDMMIVVHLCRVHILSLEEPSPGEHGNGNRQVDWRWADLGDSETYMHARAEIGFRKLIQSQVREAKRASADVARQLRAPDGGEVYRNNLQQHFDLSFKFRN